MSSKSVWLRSLCLLILFLPPLRAAAHAEEGYFRSNGVRLRYIVQGQGEPIILIHGFATTAETMWIKNPFSAPEVLPELAKEHRVIALDCRGHGQSDKPHAAEEYGPKMVEDVLRLMDYLQIKKAHVVGYSMGCVIAAKLLVAYPERLLSATLGGFGGGLFEPDAAFRSLVTATADSLEQGKGMGPLIAALTPPGEPRPSREQIDAISSAVLAGQDQAALAGCIRGLLKLEVTRRELQANRIPTLVVFGERDAIAVKGAEQIRGILFEATFKEIKGSDHNTTPANPEFRKAVREFVSTR